jgi:hypothetical protein
MTKIKIFIILLAISCIFVSAPSAKASLVGNTSQATMNLSPESGTFNVNAQFQITIYLNTRGLAVNALAAHFNYSPSLFQVVSIDYAGSIFSMQAESNINNSAGTVKISRGVTGISDRRQQVAGQMTRPDQSVIDFAVSPLPDEATLEIGEAVSVFSDSQVTPPSSDLSTSAPPP